MATPYHRFPLSMENDPHLAAATREYHGDHTIFALKCAGKAIETLNNTQIRRAEAGSRDDASAARAV
jgi:hypothetical protein